MPGPTRSTLLLPVAALLAVTALGGTLAGCGDDAPSENAAAASPAATPHDMAGMDHGASGGSTAAGAGSTSPASTTPSAAAARGEEVDQAFVRQMIPHHESAVAMAKIAATRAQHPELKKLARSIVADQTAELGTLKTFATALGVKTGSGDDETTMTQDALTLGTTMDQMGMTMDEDRLENAPTSTFDTVFIDQMSEHHYGAIAMANGEILHGSDEQLKDLASQIQLAQQGEVSKMAAWKAKWR